MSTLVDRVSITPQAPEVLRRLIQVHGPVMIHQSGGCCDGSAPMCCPRGEFHVGAFDVLLGYAVDDTPFWISAGQYDTQGNESAVTPPGRARRPGATRWGIAHRRGCVVVRAQR